MAGLAKSPAVLEDRFLAKLNQPPRSIQALGPPNAQRGTVSLVCPARLFRVALLNALPPAIKASSMYGMRVAASTVSPYA